MLDVAALESQAEGVIARERIPGLALAVVRHGRTVYARGFGLTCTEPHGRPVTPDTLFRIGSVTKPLTGTVVMRLVDEGKLALDTPVRDYVPWFKTSDAKATRTITPRLLLSHTSGLPHDHKPTGPRGDDALERRIREEVPRYPLVAPPGTKFSYSNTGIHVLAFLIETLTGKPYVDAMRDLLFEPLGMRHTTFLPSVALTYPAALGHQLTRKGQLEVEHHYAENVANYASGQAISTVLDLACSPRRPSPRCTVRTSTGVRTARMPSPSACGRTRATPASATAAPSPASAPSSPWPWSPPPPLSPSSTASPAILP
jgi:CubicO group peptidase (beta-lactamase class C family)